MPDSLWTDLLPVIVQGAPSFLGFVILAFILERQDRKHEARMDRLLEGYSGLIDMLVAYCLTGEKPPPESGTGTGDVKQERSK